MSRLASAGLRDAAAALIREGARSRRTLKSAPGRWSTLGPRGMRGQSQPAMDTLSVVTITRSPATRFLDLWGLPYRVTAKPTHVRLACQTVLFSVRTARRTCVEAPVGELRARTLSTTRATLRRSSSSVRTATTVTKASKAARRTAGTSAKMRETDTTPPTRTRVGCLQARRRRAVPPQAVRLYWKRITACSGATCVSLDGGPFCRAPDSA